MVVQIDFAASLVDAVVSGHKSATTRWPGVDLQVPCEALATSEGRMFARLEVVRLVETTSGEVLRDAALARAEGLSDGAALMELLRFFYPAMPAGDAVKLRTYHFRVLELVGPEGGWPEPSSRL
jgi:hypothetical protein